MTEANIEVKIPRWLINKRKNNKHHLNKFIETHKESLNLTCEICGSPIGYFNKYRHIISRKHLTNKLIKDLEREVKELKNPI